MKAFISVAVREFVDRRAVLVAALAAALIPIVLPLLPGLARHSVADVRGTTGLVVALCLSWVLAAGLGSSMVAAELAEGRLGFFFSRPLRPTVIWGGKLLANFVLVVGAELLVLLPTALMASNRPHFSFDKLEGWAVIGVVFGVPLLLLLATHTIAVMLRARSAWVVVDVVVLLILGFALFALVSPLMFLAPQAFAAAVIFILISLVAALTAAGAAQMAIGRTDVRRAHRALSATLWGTMLLVALLVATFSWWMFDVDPEDLVSIASVEAAPDGAWVVVEGPTAGRFDYSPRFLFNTESGAYRQLAHGGWMSYMAVAFSGDGTTAAWLEPEGRIRWRLVSAHLGESDCTPVNTDLLFGVPVGLELNEQGDRIAVLERRVVSVYDMKTGRLIIAAPVREGERVGRAWWIGDDVIRLYSAGGPDLMRASEIVISEIDLLAGSVERTGTLQIAGDDPGSDSIAKHDRLQ